MQQFSPLALRQAVAAIETGGVADPYGIKHPPAKNGDYAIGKYGIMSGNVPSWTKEALGVEMTPEQFRANPAAQDAVFDHKFGQSVAKFGSPDDAASVWFTGKPLSQVDPGASDGNTSVSEYVNKFRNNLAKYSPDSGTFTGSTDLGAPIEVGAAPKVAGLLDPTSTTGTPAAPVAPATPAAPVKDENGLTKDQASAFDGMAKALGGGAGNAPIQSMFGGDSSAAAQQQYIQRMQMAQSMFGNLLARPRGLMG